MTSDGTPWRPLVHIEDICLAFAARSRPPSLRSTARLSTSVRRPRTTASARLAEIVAAEFPGCELSIGPSGADNRSYRVSFEKIAAKLPGFSCRWTAKQGAAELRRLFDRIEFDEATYQFRAYTRLKQLHYLSRTGQIDERFFWTDQEARTANV